MVSPPADNGGYALGNQATSVSASGLLAAPLAPALDILPGVAVPVAERALQEGGCFARPLPLDGTCASAARRYFREAAAVLPLPAELLYDGVMMASELAANTLHAHTNVEGGRSGRPPVSGAPEIWVYLRGGRACCDLVCKVFDSDRRWSAEQLAGTPMAPAESVSGRGLQVVAGLSAGRWGSHLSRARLGAWKVPGKAVWFALPVPRSVAPDGFGGRRPSPEHLVDDLAAILAERLPGTMVRADEPDCGVTVLSLSRHLTIWRHGRMVGWRTAAGNYRRMDLSDLMDVAEQVICGHEEAELHAPQT